jgi:hypothetical protein
MTEDGVQEGGKGQRDPDLPVAEEARLKLAAWVSRGAEGTVSSRSAELRSETSTD